jgi:hypothetical protein
VSIFLAMAVWWPFARAYERRRMLTVPPRYDPIADKSQERFR